MESPSYPWIEDAATAATIEANNAIQRAYLRDRLIPFIRGIHQHNLTNPNNLISLSDFLGDSVGRQVDYKIVKYKKDINFPQRKFVVPKLSTRPDYMQHVNPQFIQQLTPVHKALLREGLHQVFDQEHKSQLYPHNVQELGIWQPEIEGGITFNSVEADYWAQRKKFLGEPNPLKIRFEDRFTKFLQVMDDVKCTPCAVYNRVELLVAKFAIREILHHGTWRKFKYNQGIFPLASRFVYENDPIFSHPVFEILVQAVNVRIRVQDMGQIHSAIRGLAVSFLRRHHVGLIEVDGILGLDFGLTGWPHIPNYRGDNTSIEKLCSKILQFGCAASAQACRFYWRTSENSRDSCEVCFAAMLENCYATVMTTMHFVRDATWNQLSIPIPEAPQWVKDEVEVHRVKRHFLENKNWSFCGAYNSQFKEELPSNWEGKMIKIFPNWHVMHLPSVPLALQIPIPMQQKPWPEPIVMDRQFEIIPIRLPL